MQDGNIWLMLLFQVILIALNAVFASAEIAVISMNEPKLEKMAEDGDKRAKRLYKLTTEPARFLAPASSEVRSRRRISPVRSSNGWSRSG